MYQRLFFNKVADLRPATLLKRVSGTFLRTLFLQSTSVAASDAQNADIANETAYASLIRSDVIKQVISRVSFKTLS